MDYFNLWRICLIFVSISLVCIKCQETNIDCAQEPCDVEVESQTEVFIATNTEKVVTEENETINLEENLETDQILDVTADITGVTEEKDETEEGEVVEVTETIVEDLEEKVTENDNVMDVTESVIEGVKDQNNEEVHTVDNVPENDGQVDENNEEVIAENTVEDTENTVKDTVNTVEDTENTVEDTETTEKQENSEITDAPLQESTSGQQDTEESNDQGTGPHSSENQTDEILNDSKSQENNEENIEDVESSENEIASTESLNGNEGNNAESASEAPKAPFSCEQPGRFANEENCDSFFVCILTPFGFIQLEQGCMFGHAFDALRQRCTPDRSQCNDAYQCTTPGRYADSDDSSKYYLCLRNIFGGFIQQHLSCQEGLTFNPLIKQCQLANSHADNDEIIGFVCSEEGTFADPEDCSKYITCTLKKKDKFKQKQKKCPKGEQFDSILKVCSLDENIVCG